jgi:Tfp pilus assembly protein PilN
VRPINLIPGEERRSISGTRTGPLAYLLVGALAVVVIGIVVLVLFNNQVHERESEVARLQTEKTAATANAASLSPYVSFKQLSEQRTQTVAELADARFDWARVIHQLSLVIPDDVYFTSLAASAGGAGENAEATGATGPSLQLIGCAQGQAGVAGFVAALKEVDGITRVELSSSAIKNDGADPETGPGGGSCEKPGMATFTIQAVFDDAPPSADGGGLIEEPSAEEGESSEGESEEGESTEGESGEGESSEEPSSTEGEASTSQSAATSTGGATG